MQEYTRESFVEKCVYHGGGHDGVATVRAAGLGGFALAGTLIPAL
jgi:hypothetical protein